MKLNLFASIALALMTATPVGQPRAGDSPFTDDGWVPKGRSTKASPTSGAKTPAPATKAPVPATKTATTEGKDGSSLVPAVVGLPPEIDPDKTYRIAPDDELAIKVFEVDELSSTESVSAKGTIMMPLIGVVKVGGLTADEAGALIAQTLERDYLTDPQVKVAVVKATSQKIVVMGSVKKPGVFPVSGRTTLLQAIALAEGPDRVANQEEIIIFRPDPAGQGRAYVVDLKAVLRGELQDPILVGNDRIVVPESGTAVFIKGITDTLRGFVSIPFY